MSIDLPRVNRVEVIDHTGLAYLNTCLAEVEVSFLDGGKTMKIICKSQTAQEATILAEADAIRALRSAA